MGSLAVNVILKSFIDIYGISNQKFQVHLIIDKCWLHLVLETCPHITRN